MKGIGNLLRLTGALFLILTALSFSGCTGSKIAPYGTVDVDLMDAPELDYEHVFITVKKIAFHADPNAENGASGWEIQDMSANPVTVDLAQLSNGRLYSDTSQYNEPLFSGVVLPSGTYRQIRLFLAPTEDATPAPSAVAKGLKYNNQATFEGGLEAPIRIPNIDEGIKLTPETPLEVVAGKRARLALDFNLYDDMFEASPASEIECILKPRLGYFDMDRVGAVKGKISYSDLHEPYFTILAEQVVPGKSTRVVRRLATSDPSSGTFNLYPLPVPEGSDTAVYDIVVRGRYIQTAIIKNVTVRRGSSMGSGAVDLGTIPMKSGNEFEIQLENSIHPSGAWLKFNQTLATDPIAYEVRSRHLNPYTGKLSAPLSLSSDPVQVFDFSGGSLSGPVSDATVAGNFTVVAEAVLFQPSAGVAMSGTAGGTTLFNTSLPTAQTANSLDVVVSISPSLNGVINEGYVFITSGGLIVDCYYADSLIAAGGGSMTIPNLPGGTAAAPLSGASYGVNVLGWGGGKNASGSRFDVNLATGNGTAAVTLSN